MDTSAQAPIQPEARLPRYRRVEGYPEIRIGRPRQLILEALLGLHYLTAQQLARYSFSPTSLTYVRDHLMRLYQAGYVERLYLPLDRPWGSPRAVYCLDKKGLAYLRHEGLLPAGRFRPSEDRGREGITLRHTLEVVDFLVACHELTKKVGWISVAEFRAERELRRAPLSVRDGGEVSSLVPDAWVDLHLDGLSRMSVALELDRGTHERKAFQAKVRAYLEAARGEYRRVFGSPSLTVLFLVTTGEGRLREAIRWAESELRRSGRERQADLFRFAALDPADVDPVDLFFRPYWRRPFGEGLLGLLAGRPDRAARPGDGEGGRGAILFD